jgi:thiamine-monophosphate kinase
MDLSDGLVKDLGRMARGSGTAAEVRLPEVPLSAPAHAAIAGDPSLLKALITAGDDYEVLAAVAPESAEAFARLARDAGVLVANIGCMRSSGLELVSVLDRQGSRLAIERSGWDHF